MVTADGGYEDTGGGGGGAGGMAAAAGGRGEHSWSGLGFCAERGVG